MKKQNEQRLVPKLRFKGFSEDWKQEKFSNIFKRVSESSDSEAIPIVEYEDIDNESRVLKSDFKYRFSSRDGLKFSEKDILFGKLRPYLRNQILSDFKGKAIGDFWILRSQMNHPIFDYYLLDTPRLSHITNLTTGTRMPRSDWNTIDSYNIKVPVEIKETERIAHFLSLLDKAISLHKRKIQVLKNQKNLYLNKMFISQQGDVQLRFKGFTEPWEQEKLSNVANIVGGGTPSTKEASYWNGAINWFTPNEIGNNKYVKGSLRKITERGLNNSSAQLLPANKTILFTSRATIGTIAILEEEASTNQGFQSLIVNDFNDVNFLYYKLLTMKKSFLKNSVGSTFLEISGKTMKKIDINIPSKNEQGKIGNLLSNIDKAISLHNKKLKKLESLKKEYLNYLFI